MPQPVDTASRQPMPLHGTHYREHFNNVAPSTPLPYPQPTAPVALRNALAFAANYTDGQTDGQFAAHWVD